MFEVDGESPSVTLLHEIYATTDRWALVASFDNPFSLQLQHLGVQPLRLLG
jgi:hypothetical protein